MILLFFVMRVLILIEIPSLNLMDIFKRKFNRGNVKELLRGFGEIKDD